jgi:hypothetical protein
MVYYGYGYRYSLAYTLVATLLTLSSLWILYHVLTGQGERVSFAWFLTSTSPYMWYNNLVKNELCNF